MKEVYRGSAVLILTCILSCLSCGRRHDVNYYLEVLKHGNGGERVKAVKSLSRMKDPRVVEPLERALVDDYAPVRKAAAHALGGFGYRAETPQEEAELLVALQEWDKAAQLGGVAIAPLDLASRDSDYRICNKALRALGQIRDPRVVEVLMVGLEHTDEHVRGAAAQLLGEIEDTRAIKPLVAVLHDSFPEVRRAAGDALTAIGAPSVEALIIALRGDSWESCEAIRALGRIKDPRAVRGLLWVGGGWDTAQPVREALIAIGVLGFEPLLGALDAPDTFPYCVSELAAWALGQIKDPRAVAPLLASVKRKDRCENHGWTVASALSQIGVPAIDALLAGLKDDDDRVRSVAADALGEIGHARAAQALATAMEDDSWRVRKSAAEALGRIKDADTVQTLMAGLKDSDPNVRESAVRTLGRRRNPETIEALVSCLRDSDSRVRMVAAEELESLKYRPRTQEERTEWFIAARRWDKVVRIGAPAVDQLIVILKDGDWAVRDSAARALGTIKDERAFQPLVAALNDDNSAAVKALVRIGGVRAIEPLLLALKNGNETAAYELGRIRDPRAVEPLIAALKSGNLFAAEALGRIRDPRAVDALVAALQNDSWYMRKVAARALGEIGDKRAISALAAKLTHWHINEDVAKALEKLHWRPQTQEDQVHLWVAERSGGPLLREWEQTRRVLCEDMISNEHERVTNAVFMLITLADTGGLPHDIRSELITALAGHYVVWDEQMAMACIRYPESWLTDAAAVWAVNAGYRFVYRNGAPYRLQHASGNK